MSAKILISQDEQGRPHHIDEARTDVQYFCFGCKKPLIQVKSKPRKKCWHYRHKTKSSCSEGYDKALHDMVVRTLLESTWIELPSIGRIIYSNPHKEISVGLHYRSDVMAKYLEHDVHFEVIVTHELDDEKQDFYRDNQVGCVSIKVPVASYRNARLEDVQRFVLEDCNWKEIIYWPGELPQLVVAFDKEPQPNGSDFFSAVWSSIKQLPAGVIAGIALLIILLGVCVSQAGSKRKR